MQAAGTPRLPLQLLSFALVGTVGVAVDATVLVALLALVGDHPYLARLGSFAAAVTSNWALNRRFTFASAGRAGAFGQWLRFVAANSAGAAVNYAVYAGLVAILAPVREHPVLGVAAGAIAGLVLNFVASRRLVFARRG